MTQMRQVSAMVLRLKWLSKKKRAVVPVIRLTEATAICIKFFADYHGAFSRKSTVKWGRCKLRYFIKYFQKYPINSVFHALYGRRTEREEIQMDSNVIGDYVERRKIIERPENGDFCDVIIQFSKYRVFLIKPPAIGRWPTNDQFIYLFNHFPCSAFAFIIILQFMNNFRNSFQ